MLLWPAGRGAASIGLVIRKPGQQVYEEEGLYGAQLEARRGDGPRAV